MCFFNFQREFLSFIFVKSVFYNFCKVFHFLEWLLWICSSFTKRCNLNFFDFYYVRCSVDLELAVRLNLHVYVNIPSVVYYLTYLHTWFIFRRCSSRSEVVFGEIGPRTLQYEIPSKSGAQSLFQLRLSISLYVFHNCLKLDLYTLLWS